MTYFSAWPKWAARVILALLAALVILGGVLAPSQSIHTRPSPPDFILYRAIVERVAHGEDYYAAAAAEHRARGYPTTPAQVFREPALAWTLAGLRTDPIRRAVLVGLSLLVLIGFREAVARSKIDPRLRVSAVILSATGVFIAWFPASPYLHEVWAALLIALSLCSYRLSHWSLAVVLGIAACLFRELALPYLAAMAVFALYERKYRELAGWIAGMAVFCALFAWHLAVAGTLHLPGDAVSRGWFSFGGWPFVLQTAKINLVLLLAPKFVVAFAVCLAIVGLIGTRDLWLSRIALIVCGYLAAFSIIGRPDNLYWGLLISPLLPIGVALAPAALRDLVASARAPRPIPSTVLALTRICRSHSRRFSASTATVDSRADCAPHRLPAEPFSR